MLSEKVNVLNLQDCTRPYKEYRLTKVYSIHYKIPSPMEDQAHICPTTS